MIIDDDLSTNPETAVCAGRYSSAEAECKRFLSRQLEAGSPDTMTVVTCLQTLGQALEGQEKLGEGLDARLRARNMLLTLMNMP